MINDKIAKNIGSAERRLRRGDRHNIISSFLQFQQNEKKVFNELLNKQTENRLSFCSAFYGGDINDAQQ